MYPPPPVGQSNQSTSYYPTNQQYYPPHLSASSHVYTNSSGYFLHNTPPPEGSPLDANEKHTTHHLHHSHSHHKPKTIEEQEKFLENYDFFVLIDKSKSMNSVIRNKLTRWNQAKECLDLIVTEAAKYDQNGLDLCLFGDKTEWKSNVESAQKVKDIFMATKADGQSTDLAKALQETFNKHFEKKEEKHNQKSIILVITDGLPDDQKEVRDKIIKCTERISQKKIFDYHGSKKTLEIGIRFFQVGNDEGAKKFLTDLDDDLEKQGAKADIVDTGQLADLLDVDGVRQAFVNAIFD